MKFVLEFNMDNAAFEDNYLAEVAYVMRGVMSQCASETQTDGIIRDSNGNTIGKWDVVKDDPATGR